MHVPEGIRLPIFLAVGGCLDGKDARGMRNGGGVPGTTGQRVCAETFSVVSKRRGDHFEDFKKEPGGRGRCGGGLW